MYGTRKGWSRPNPQAMPAQDAYEESGEHRCHIPSPRALFLSPPGQSPPDKSSAPQTCGVIIVQHTRNTTFNDIFQRCCAAVVEKKTIPPPPRLIVILILILILGGGQRTFIARQNNCCFSYEKTLSALFPVGKLQNPPRNSPFSTKVPVTASRYTSNLCSSPKTKAF